MRGRFEELRTFWGLPDVEGERLSISAADEVPGRVVELEVEDELRPRWIERGDRIPVFSDQLPVEDVSDGRILAHFFEGSKERPAIVEAEGGIVFRFDPDRSISTTLSESYFIPKRPIHTYLGLPYHLVPGPVRLRLFGWLTRSHGAKAGSRGFPEWPIARSVEGLRSVFLRAWCRAERREVAPRLWPEGKKYAFALSHDVDTAQGWSCISELTAVEKQHGFRSCWFFLGDAYSLDPIRLDDLRRSGNEIGSHGDRHDNRIAYLSAGEIAKRLDRCSPMMEQYQVRGFRSPSLLETSALRAILKTRFEYASDTPDTEIGSLIAPRRGCGSCFPFVKQGMIEIPITLPMEDKLAIAGFSQAEMLDLWRAKLLWIRTVGGVAHLAVHSEPHLWKRCRQAYAQLLEDIAADPTVWRANLGEIARWWKETRANG